MQNLIYITSDGVSGFLIHKHSTDPRTKHPIATPGGRRGAVCDRPGYIHAHLTMHHPLHISMRLLLHLLQILMQERRRRRVTSMLIGRPLRPEQLLELTVIHVFLLGCLPMILPLESYSHCGLTSITVGVLFLNSTMSVRQIIESPRILNYGTSQTVSTLLKEHRFF